MLTIESRQRVRSQVFRQFPAQKPQKSEASPQMKRVVVVGVVEQTAAVIQRLLRQCHILLPLLMTLALLLSEHYCCCYRCYQRAMLRLTALVPL